jgi:predicted DNA-binding transcriptional regulator AlpA
MRKGVKMVETTTEYVLTVEQARARLKISRNLIYKLCQTGAIPGIIRLPGSKRILIAAKPFEDFLASGINPMERGNDNQS